MRCKSALLFLLAATLANTGFAHSFGTPYQLPMPYWMYIYGAMAALILSFLILGFFYNADYANRPPRYLDIKHTTPTSIARKLRLLSVLKICVFLSFGLAVVSGLIGNQDHYRNFNMTFFWISFALGASYLSAVFGNWYDYLNPWRSMCSPFRAFQQGRYRYPEKLAYWPAVTLYMVFICLELFGNTRPYSLSLVLIGYTAINVLCVYLVGSKAWFRYGELFSVMFSLIAKMAPIHFQNNNEGKHNLLLRMPFSGLLQQRIEHRSLLVFILFMLSSTAYDGLRETSLWFNIFWKDPFHILEPLLGQHPLHAYVLLRPWYIGFETVCLLISPYIYLGLFLFFLWLGKKITRSELSVNELSLRFGFSLLPIALVYHVTHYYTLVLSQGLKIRGLISDPFGWGWDLFGTAISGRIPILPDMGFIWNSQVWLILIGHVASVYLAHAEALRSFPNARQASISQLPMLLLMVIFTGVGLWILAQPLQG
ncbi:hypothetical protein [Zhongshania aquimaris]|uniref:Fenitrothion hydrolase FedB n=1 Tax=Zhongshania aquimaris TaxID=2857107 RepID=A0ABS6VQC6_9GAMM|nr:hypothetical protein [Zhongshania aquimaris]MBW2940522.1 hypothetical protein [Zhongshania aquimaris]